MPLGKAAWEERSPIANAGLAIPPWDGRPEAEAGKQDDGAKGPPV
jgi:hypothetical protein